jgi:hypothetical protein
MEDMEDNHPMAAVAICFGETVAGSLGGVWLQVQVSQTGVNNTVNNSIRWINGGN